MPRIFLNITLPDAKSLPVPANGGLLQKKKQKKTGGNAQTPLLWIKEVPLQRCMSAGCQNDTQLKQTNKTSYASCIWDGGYTWVKRELDQAATSLFMHVIRVSRDDRVLWG